MPTAPGKIQQPQGSYPTSPANFLMAAAERFQDFVRPVANLTNSPDEIMQGLEGAPTNRQWGGGAGRYPYPHPQHLEDAATEWARGNMTNKEFRDRVRGTGWYIDPYELQRTRKSTISVFDPSGTEHELQP